jgi:chromosomal replication initiation ATPase DnaA
MTAPSGQLVMDLAIRPALGVEDFLVSASNAAALETVERWPDWPHWALIVTGPALSGKTHLANVWRVKSNAAQVQASAISDAQVAVFSAHRALVVENLETGVGDERALFHLLNLAREHAFSLLMTSRALPGELSIALPDLRSRLRATPVAAIEAPDEHLLQGVLIKHFADRQLLVEPHVVAYIMRHMERSMRAAHETVAELDRRSLVAHRRVTRALAAEVLKSGPDPEADEKDA